MRTLISGGSSDIGRAIVERRISMSDEIATTTSRDPSRLTYSKPVCAVEFHLNDPMKNSNELINWIHDGVDALILNAATRNSSLRRIDEYDSSEIREMMDINFYGNVWLLQQCLRKMKQQRFGRIVYISSMAVLGGSKYSLYSASKGALEALIRGIATDYGEFNITANSIRPAVVETERTKRFWKRTSYVEVMKPLIPLSRFALPLDVAKSTDYFLEKDCYSTGSVLDVSGGLPQLRVESLFKVGL